jgi:hypothetical protein
MMNDFEPTRVSCARPFEGRKMARQGDEGTRAEALTLRECYLLMDALKEIADNHQL